MIDDSPSRDWVAQLPQSLRAAVETRLAAAGDETAESLLAAALDALDRDAQRAAAPPGSLGELRTLNDAQRRAIAERDFVIGHGTRVRAIAHPEAILQTTAEAIGRFLDADRAGYYRIVGDELEFGACWSSRRLDRLSGRLPLAAFGDGFRRCLSAGHPLSASNVRTDPNLEAATFEKVHASAMISAPVIRNLRWIGGFYVHHAVAREWSPAEVALVSEITAISADAIDRVDAVQDLHDRIGVQRGELVTAAASLLVANEGRGEAEGQVRQLQKMELVGQLAGGIAHDFNNMLTVIVGALNLIQRRLARGERDIGRHLEAALDGSKRAAELTHRLLAFARQQPLAPQAVDVNRAIRQIEDLLRRTLGDGIELESVLGAGTWPAYTDANQLDNAIMNVAVNARDAMDGAGKLTIEASNVHVEADYARRHEMAEGQYVVIAVSDTGSGMSDDVLSKAFDPFFTTKGVGKGTGLGLSQVLGFVRQSGGHAKIYSELGVGTTIRLYFRRYHGPTTGDAVEHPATGSGLAPRGRSTETILVVEDEERVRAFAVETLTELGYSVVHAPDGATALALIDGGQTATLLFTDIVMPGMTGRRLADLATARLPDLRVLYTTGFTRNAVVHNGVLDPGIDFLAKPFTFEQVAQKVRAVLDRPRD